MIVDRFKHRKSLQFTFWELSLFWVSFLPPHDRSDQDVASDILENFLYEGGSSFEESVLNGAMDSEKASDPGPTGSNFASSNKPAWRNS